MEDKIASFFVWIVAFLFSTTVHEAAHAWTALKLGDPTAYQGGQVSLNPLPHLKREPVGMLIVPIIGFLFFNFMIGWASAPMDRRWAERYPHRSAKVAWAGPLSNLILLVLSTIGLVIMAKNGYVITMLPSVISLGQSVTYFLLVLGLLNLMLFVFNLLPLPPLDGSEGILLFFSESKAHGIRYKMAAVGMFGILIAFLIFRKIFPIVVGFWMTVLTILIG